ncbi:MAG: hypothetical protein HZB55_19330 [Deltaproteobacteria bacterium]|nr:hypothetical protein [Deltaproteobacteria bacterium]
MARRIGLLLAVLSVAVPCWAGFPARAGVSEALLGRWERAADRLGATPQPDRAERFFLARALLELDLPTPALEILGELARTEGAFGAPALEAAVDRLFAAGRYAEVAALAPGARSERFQDESRLRYQLGESLYLVGEASKARPHLEKVGPGAYQTYALYTLALVAHAEARVLDAVEILGRAVDAAASHPDPAVAAALADRCRLTRGRILYQAGAGLSGLSGADRRRLFDLAAAQFDRVGKKSLWYADALRGSAWCSLERGESPRALASFEGAAELDPSKRHEDLWAQGRAYQRLGFYDEAARFYGQAREAASRAAGEVLPEDAGAAPERWARLVQGVGSARERVERVASGVRGLTAAADVRAGRLAALEERLRALRERGGALAAEVMDLGANLESYLDAIGAPALFPRAERPRLDAAMARQERVLRELATLEAVFERLGASSTWQRAAADQQKRGQVLWARLNRAQANLSGSQLVFLQALKGRVQTREEELRRAIAGRQADVAALDGALAAGRDRLAREREGLRGRGTAFQGLEARRAALARSIEALSVEVQGAQEAEARRAWAQRGETLRLRADAYALDETEALQLWEEKGRAPPAGAAP